MTTSYKESQPPSLLAGIELKVLKSIKIAITRNNIAYNGRLSPLKRSLESPENLKVHMSGGSNRGIFDRDDVKVNTVPLHEEHAKKAPSVDHNSEEGYSSNSSTESPKKNEKKKGKKVDGIFKDYVNKKPPFPLPPKTPEKKDEPAYSNEYDKYGNPIYPSTSKEYRRSPPSRSRRYSRSSDSCDSSGSRSHKKLSHYDTSRGQKKRSPVYESRKLERYSRDSSFSPHRHRTDRHSPKLRPGEYRPRKRTPDKLENRYYKESSPRRYDVKPYRKQTPDRHRARSPAHHEDPRHSRRYSPNARRKRSQTPLRPGEYRPPRKRSPSDDYRKSPPRSSRSRRSSRSPPTSDYRSRKKTPPPHEERRVHLSRSRSPRDYRRKSYEPPLHPDFGLYENPDFGPMLRPPLFPRYLPRGVRQILVPHVQYIPVPAMPQIRPQFFRPPIQYNNRAIPRFTDTAGTSRTGGVKPEEKGDKSENNNNDK